jgi:hypothetical protein
MSHLFRFGLPVVALLAGGALLSSCGGGGGSAVVNSTYRPTGCDATTYSPNYITENSGDAGDATSSGFSFWRHFPISVYIASTDSATRAATVAGFNEWVAATGGRVSYKIVSGSTGANLSVKFSALKPTSDTLGLTTVYYVQGQNYITRATMQLFVLNADGSVKTTQNSNGINQTIAAHEFGHALGIGPHSLVASDLMYYSIDESEGFKPVSTRDLNTLKSVYCNNFPTGSALERTLSGPVQSRTLPPLQRATK